MLWTAALAVALLVLARPAPAWETRLDGPPFPSLASGHWKAVAFLPAGDVVVAGTSFGWGYDDPCWFVAARFARDGGTLRWQTKLAECGDDHSFGDFGNEELLIDSAGDLIVGRRDSMARAMGVYKLDGASGALLWHRQPIAFNKHGPFIHHVALTPGGDVVATASETWTYYDSSRLAVVRLDGANGDEVWRQRFAGDTAAATSELEDLSNAAVAVAIDSVGDVVLAGKLYDAVYIWDDEQEFGYWTERAQPTVLKLAAADGTELWRRDDFAAPLTALALTDSGDPLVLGLGRGTLDVQRLEGASGAASWSATYPVGAASDLIGGAIVIDGAERLTASTLAWRATSDATAAWRPQVVHADATTGTPLWSVELASQDGDCALPRWSSPAATVLALSPAPASAPVVAGGYCSVAGSGLFVTRLARASGATEWRHAGAASATRQTAYALAAADDDLAVAGQQAASGERYGPLVAVLDATSGSEIWRDERGGHAAGELLNYPSPQSARQVAVAPGGRVVALGEEALLPTLASVALRELAPGDGHLMDEAFWGPAVASDATVHSMSGRALVALPAGDLLALGVSSHYLGGATIERRDGAGEVRFRIERPWADGDALGLPDGDAVVWGYERQGPGATPPTRFQIERLAPDGTTRWRHEFSDLRTGWSRLGRRWVDATGATLVLHTTPADWTLDAATALALDSTDGRLLWRRDLPTDDVSLDLLSDGTALLGWRPPWSGNALSAWTIEHLDRAGRALGAPLVLADLWARGRLTTLTDGAFVVAQQRLPSGPGHEDDTAMLRLTKLDPATMRVVWETVVAPSNTAEIAPFGLAGLPSGDVLLSALPAAWSTEPGTPPQHVLARFAGRSGEVRWSRSLAAMPVDLSDEDDTLVAVALDGEIWREDLHADTSDFVVAGFDGLTGGDRPLGLTGACRAALGRAHAAALDTRYTALARCRNGIARGGIGLSPGDCALEPHTAALLARANQEFVPIERSCGAGRPAGAIAGNARERPARQPVGSPDSADLDAGDGSALPAGHGVGPDFRATAEARVAAAVEELLHVVYGATQPTDFAARRCQRALSEATRDLTRVTAFAARGCIDGIHEGLALPAAPPACAERGPGRELATRVGRRARLWIERSCSPAALSELDACAGSGGTVDTLISPDGRGGCLVEAARAALALS